MSRLCDPSGKPRRNVWVLIAVTLTSLFCFGQSASAQVTYTYVGNTFTLFSCGQPGGVLCTTPPPGSTSYTTDDFVTATLTLTDPLPANLQRVDIRNHVGFSLTMNDGHQELTLEPLVPGEALVSTDAAGNIIGPWSMIIGCCLFPNNSIATLNDPDVRGIGDQGALSAPQGNFPDTPFDSGVIFRSPGVWSGGISSPEDLTQELIGDVDALINVELNPGQGNGLTRPLRNALRSIDANRIQAACSQLKDFINEVIDKTPPLTSTTSNALIADASAIRTVLSCTD